MLEIFCKRHVGELWRYAVKDNRNGIVYPMKHHARHDAACAVIHPSDEQSEEESAEALRQIAVNDGEEQGCYAYSQPAALLAEG